MARRRAIERGDVAAELLPALVQPSRLVRSTMVPAELEIEPKVLDVLDQLGRLGDPRVVRYLVWLLAADSSAVRRAAASTIAALVPQSISEIVDLESSIRGRAWYTWDEWWPRAKAVPSQRLEDAQARRLVRDGVPVATLGILSFNENGYVREIATRELARSTTGEEIQFLLLRANDWVSPVRVSAERALLHRCTIEHMDQFARALPLLERLTARQELRTADYWTWSSGRDEGAVLRRQNGDPEGS